ncbi:MAG: isopentenyl-diphosphate Delta-isomerase [Armatimonas sp.]
MAQERVILVTEADEEVGTQEKLAAHQNGGQLHRAFSVFLFHPDGRMLLQCRALTKYHFGGLWTNACCSHPHPGEATPDAAARRLQEELSISAELTEAFSFVYRAEDSATGLTEHEFDHVFIGRFDGVLVPNPEEVAEVAWVEPEVLLADLAQNPTRYTPWFHIALERVMAVVRHPEQ